MKIRFKTKDNLTAVKDCPDIDGNISRVMSPMWDAPLAADGKRPERFMEFRHYEFRGEIIDGIPTVHEI